MDMEDLRIQYRHVVPFFKGAKASNFVMERQAAVDMALQYKQINMHVDGYTSALAAHHITVCDLVCPDLGVPIATGYAFCSQSYDRKLGNKIALGRAFKQYTKGVGR